jgi:hypothetical protein
MSNFGIQIKDFEKYIITPQGEVYSTMYGKQRKLKPQRATQSKKGYYQVRLFNKETPKGKLQYIHRLVYETFIGEITEGNEIDHVDEDTANNSIENIQLISRRANIKKHNRKRFGIDMRLHRDKLIKDYEELGSYKKVGEKWGKSEQVIYRTIKNLVHYFCSKEQKFKTRTYDKNIKDKYTEKDQRYKNRFKKNYE